MPPRKKAAETLPVEAPPVPSRTAELKQMLAAHKNLSLIEFASKSSNRAIKTRSTGFPSLDLLLHLDNPGLPLGRLLEIYSKNPSAGKSSICGRIMGDWQRQLQLVLLGDVERSNDTAYLAQQGCILDDRDPAIAELTIITVPENIVYSAEDWLMNLAEAATLYDLIVLDSIAALEPKVNQDKDLTAAAKVGGVGQVLNRFCKEIIGKRATTLCINQIRSDPGGYSPNPNVQPTVTPGGRALKFFSSIRIEMANIGKLKKGKEGPVYGFTSSLNTVKNKISTPYRQIQLDYFFSLRGFSPYMDYLRMSVRNNIVSKSGGTHTFEKWSAKSELAFHDLLVEDQDLYGRLKEIVDADLKTIAAGSLTEGPEPTKEEEARAREEEQESSEEFRNVA